MERIFWTILVISLFASVVQGWGKKDRIRLTDVQALTLHNGRMTNGRRSSPVPQVKCVGGTAGCNTFVPKVIQCYNHGSDGYDVQWECKADMDNRYRFGKVAVSCEGYDYPDDPFILKGSCGVEFTIDHVDDNGYDSGYDSGNHQSYHGKSYHGQKRHHRKSGWMSSFVMWGVLAFIAYYIYSTLKTGNNDSSSTSQSTYQSAPTSPPPPGFRPEFTQESTQSSSASPDNSSNYGGFWTGMGLGSLAGYLFGNRGYGNSGYYHHRTHQSPHSNSWFGGNNGWFGGNYGNNGWFGNSDRYNDSGGSGWFGSSSGSSSGWSSTYRRSGSGGSSSSSSGTRTASGFGGTKRR